MVVEDQLLSAGRLDFAQLRGIGRVDASVRRSRPPFVGAQTPGAARARVCCVGIARLPAANHQPDEALQLKTPITVVLSADLMTSVAAAAADDMKKGDGAMSKTAKSVQEYKEHMETAKKGISRDNAMDMKQDVKCADLMKKQEMVEAGLSASASKPTK